MTTEPKYLTIEGAADALHTNRRRIWQLIRDHQLETIENPLDRREKLIPRADVERLADFAHQRLTPGPGSSERRPQPRSFDLLDDPTLQSEEIEDYLLSHWQPE